MLDYSYPGRWHDYFVAIETGLSHLRQFAFGISEAWDKDGYSLPFEREEVIVPALKKDRYMGFDARIGLYQFIEPLDDPEYGRDGQRPTCDEEDRHALKALYRKIGQRVDCGTLSIGRHAVENLVQTEGFRLY